MNRIYLQDLIDINSKICAKWPDLGEHAVINQNNLESALSVFDSYFDTEEEIAAAMFRSLIKGHGFLNANKRTAFCALVLAKNPLPSGEEIEQLAIEVAVGHHSVDELATRLYGENRTPVEGLIEEIKGKVKKKSLDFGLGGMKYVKDPVGGIDHFNAQLGAGDSGAEGGMGESLEENIEKHDTLNPKLFDTDGEMKEEVRDKLLEIADKFMDNLKEDGIDIKADDIQVIGSNASYNYNDQSDIDLHIFSDLSVYPNKEDLAEKLYNAYRSMWNDKYSPTIGGLEVEVYVEPSGE